MGVGGLKVLYSPVSWGLALSQSSDDHILSFYITIQKSLRIGMMANKGKTMVEEDSIKWMEPLKTCGNRCKVTELALALSGARKVITMRRQDKAWSSCFHNLQKLWFLKVLSDKSQFLWQLGVGWHFFASWNHNIHIKKAKKFLLPQANRFAFVPISTVVWSSEDTERRPGSVDIFMSMAW